MVCRGDDLFNVIEAAVALSEGVRVSSAAAVAWHFAGRDPEAREKIALRIIAFSFFGLAAYVTVDAIRSLLGIGEARHSTIGIMLATASLIIMPGAVVGSTARRSRTGFAFSGGRFKANVVVHLSVGRAACRPGAQQSARLELGRPDRRPGDSGNRRQGRRRCVERRRLLCGAISRNYGGPGAAGCSDWPEEGVCRYRLRANNVSFRSSISGSKNRERYSPSPTDLALMYMNVNAPRNRVI